MICQCGKSMIITSMIKESFHGEKEKYTYSICPDFGNSVLEHDWKLLKVEL